MDASNENSVDWNRNVAWNNQLKNYNKSNEIIFKNKNNFYLAGINSSSIPKG